MGIPASLLGVERCSEELHEMEGFYRQRRVMVKNDCIVSDKVFFLWGKVGICQQFTSLVLMREFQIDWFKVTFLGNTKIAIRLIKYCLGLLIVGLSPSDSFLVLLSLFFTPYSKALNGLSLPIESSINLYLSKLIQ